MKKAIKKVWRLGINLKNDLVIQRIQDVRVKLYAKRTGHFLPRVSLPRYSLDRLNSLPSLPEITHTANYSADTFSTLDSMILAKLQLLQFRIPFQEAKFLILNSSRHGLGSILDCLSKGLVYSYLYNRTLLLNDKPHAYDFCYEPISIHSLKEINNGSIYTKRMNFLPQKERIVSTNIYKLVFSRPLNRFLNPVHPLPLPLGLLYIQGLILGSFLSLKQEYKTHIREKRKAIGFKNPIIGVHIRQGDILYNANQQIRNIPYKVYMEVIEYLVDKTGIKNVFITTDSEDIIQQLPKDSGIDFIYDDNEKRYNNHAVNMLRRRPELRKQETMTSIKNIYLLAACNYIIGSASDWFPISTALSYFHYKKLNGIRIVKSSAGDYSVVYRIWPGIRNNMS